MKNGSAMIKATIVILLAAVIGIISVTAPFNVDIDSLFTRSEAGSSVSGNKTTSKDKVRLSLWYSKDDLTDYLTFICNDYYEKTGVRVIPCYKEDVDFIDELAGAKSSDDAPDLFVTDNYNLEIASMSGMAKDVEIGDMGYPQSAVKSVTYKGKTIAYPIYFDTSFLVYNKTYIETYARDQIEANLAQEAADNAEGNEEPVVSGNATDAEVASMVSQLMPECMADFETFAEQYDAPEKVRGVISWDSEDIFYNYFVVGDSLDFGGEYGDDESILEIRGTDSVKALRSYKELMEFFSLSEEKHEYTDDRDAFANGELVFTIASTDILKALDKRDMKENGWEYDIMRIPAVCEGIESKPMSVTGCICINDTAYDEASEFARFVASPENTGVLYDMAGRLAPIRGSRSEVDGAAYDKIIDCYENSVPAIKLMNRQDYWMKLEIALQKVLAGADIQIILQNLEKEL